MARKLHISILLAGLVVTAPAGGTVLRVNDDSTCTSDCGGTWNTAFPRLEQALRKAVPGDQIWVAAGTYRPSDCAPNCTSSDRNFAFRTLRCTEAGGDCGNREPGQPCGSQGSCTPFPLTCTDASGACPAGALGEPCGDEGICVALNLYGGFTGVLSCSDPSGDCTGKEAGESCGSSGTCFDPELPTCSEQGGDCTGKGVGEPCGAAGACKDPRTFGCVSGDRIGKPCREDRDCCFDAALCPTGACLNSTVLSGDLLGDDGVPRTEAECTCPGCNWDDTRERCEDVLGIVVPRNDDNAYEVVRIEQSDVALDGFVVTDGHDEGGGGSVGAGMRIHHAEPLIRNCMIAKNRARLLGAGMFLNGADPLIENCVISENVAQHPNNQLTFGGGIAAETNASSPTIIASIIAENAIYGHSAWGAGLMFIANCDACVPEGGFGGSIQIIDTLVAKNRAIRDTGAAQGGGLFVDKNAQLTLTNCTIAGNQASSEGGGLAAVAGAIVTIDNSIFWENTAASARTMFVDNSSVDVNFSNIEEFDDEFYVVEQNCPGDPPQCIDFDEPTIGDEGVPDDDPNFVNPIGMLVNGSFDGWRDKNYRIRRQSRCIDAANNALVASRQSLPGLFVDIEGYKRIVDDPLTANTGEPSQECALVDMGAHEFTMNAPLPAGEGLCYEHTGQGGCTGGRLCIRGTCDIPSNRFLGFVPGNEGKESVIRVRLVEWRTPTPGFDESFLRSRWLGPPAAYSENYGVDLPKFVAAKLVDSEAAWTRDWSQTALAADFPDADTSALYVYDCDVVPDGLYEIQVFAQACTGAGTATNGASDILRIRTAEWGDIVEPFGTINVVDVTSVIDKYKGLETAPSKTRALLRGNVPPVDSFVTVIDILDVVDGFHGLLYNYGEPGSCP